MRSSALVVALAAACAVPAVSSAQTTVTGRFIDFTTGQPASDVSFRLHQVSEVSDEFGAYTVTDTDTVEPCEDGATMDCVQPNGTFSVTTPGGKLTLELADDSPYLSALGAVNTANGTSFGDIVLYPSPIKLTVRVGGLVGGGTAPVFVRVLNSQDYSFAIPVTATLRGSMQTANGRLEGEETTLSATLPATLADTGFLQLGTITVPASVPVGASYCARVQLTLTGNPGFLIAGPTTACAIKTF